MKTSLLVLAALLSISTFAAEKLKSAGQKNPSDVVEKDGIYTVKPQGGRIQLYPAKGHRDAVENMEFEVVAEVSGKGTINLGLHFYAPPFVWKASVGSGNINVDTQDIQTVKAVLTVNRKDINRVLPLLTVFSGEVKVKSLTANYKNGLSKNNMKTAPIFPKWQYIYANAINCTMTDGTLNLITVGRQMTELAAPYKKAAAGEKVQLSGKISGKGRVVIGLHLYDARRTWQGTVWKQINVNGEVTELPEMTVINAKGKNATVLVRPSIRIVGNSNISLKDIAVK